MNNFDKPLGEWVEEEITIPSFEPKFNEAGELVGIKHTTKKATQKTMYQEAKEIRLSCADGQHYWYIPDKHDHVAHCRNNNCKKRRIIRAVFEKVSNGKILDRSTNELID